MLVWVAGGNLPEATVTLSPLIVPDTQTLSSTKIKPLVGIVYVPIKVVAPPPVPILQVPQPNWVSAAGGGGAPGLEHPLGGDLRVLILRTVKVSVPFGTGLKTIL